MKGGTQDPKYVPLDITTPYTVQELSKLQTELSHPSFGVRRTEMCKLMLTIASRDKDVLAQAEQTAAERAAKLQVEEKVNELHMDLNIAHGKISEYEIAMKRIGDKVEELSKKLAEQIEQRTEVAKHFVESVDLTQPAKAEGEALAPIGG